MDFITETVLKIFSSPACQVPWDALHDMTPKNILKIKAAYVFSVNSARKAGHGRLDGLVKSRF